MLDEARFNGVAFVLDITKRKRAEEALQEAHNGLERRVAERTAELAKANEELLREIEERRRAEESLRLSEKQTRLLLDSLPVGVVAILDGRIVYVNPATIRLYGATGLDELLGMDVLKILPEDRRPVLSNDLERHLSRSEAVQPHDGAILRSDGTRLEVEASAAPLHLDGRPGTLIAFRDISERKRAEEKTRKSRELLQAIIDNTPALIYVKDLEGRVTTANRALCQAAGRDMQDVLGKTSRDVVTGSQDAEIHMANDRRVIETGQAILTEESSFERVFLSVKFPLKDTQGRAFAIGGVSTDITERKQAEAALRQSHEELSAIYDGMVDGLLVTDIETKRFVRANAAICHMLGYSEAELLSLSVMDIHPADALPHILERVGMSDQTPGCIALLRKDESVFYAEVIGRFMVYSGKRCAMAIFRDITERKQAQEALQRQYQTLKHLLQSSDHERQLIAYEIHDGLAQQLAGAIMQLQAFEHLKGKKPKEAAKAYDAGLTMLRQGHFEARRLIAGVRPPILDESGTVEAIAHLVHELGREKGPKIENRSRVDFDRLDPTLENAIYRIAQEALTNACKHSKSEEVQVSLLQSGDRLRIAIRDWGVGFDPKTVPKNHFGLEGIRQRAKLLGGKCSIRSTGGKGTRVTVELPVVLRDEET